MFRTGKAPGRVAGNPFRTETAVQYWEKVGAALVGGAALAGAVGNSDGLASVQFRSMISGVNTTSIVGKMVLFTGASREKGQLAAHGRQILARRMEEHAEAWAAPFLQRLTAR